MRLGGEPAVGLVDLVAALAREVVGGQMAIDEHNSWEDVGVFVVRSATLRIRLSIASVEGTERLAVSSRRGGRGRLVISLRRPVVGEE